MAQCIYALRRVILFRVSEEGLEHGPRDIILERQISYFADFDSINGMWDHLGDDHPLSPDLEAICNRFGKKNPRKPFKLWQGLDADFKDLVSGMTNFDPKKRITAEEALAHPWFHDVEQ